MRTTRLDNKGITGSRRQPWLLPGAPAALATAANAGIQWLMTWAFLYLVSALLGLILAAACGLLRDLRTLANHDVVVTDADQRGLLHNLLGRMISPGLTVFGATGLLLGTRTAADQPATLLEACTVGALVGLVTFVAIGRRKGRRGPIATVNRGVAVRDIPAGGYGQVRLEQSGGAVVMAAQSIDERTIVAGVTVEIVDASHSVLTVRIPNSGT
jgi:hypothetical protein